VLVCVRRACTDAPTPGVHVCVHRKQRLQALEKGRAARQDKRRSERKHFFRVTTAQIRDVRVDQGEFFFLQELHWSKLHAVMMVVLQVLPQVQAPHVSQMCVYFLNCFVCMCARACLCVRAHRQIGHQMCLHALRFQSMHEAALGLTAPLKSCAIHTHTHTHTRTHARTHAHTHTHATD